MGPLQGKSRGGESERGRIGKTLEEGPLPFWCHLGEQARSKILKKTVLKHLGSWNKFRVPKVLKIGILGSFFVQFWEVFGAMVK